MIVVGRKRSSLFCLPLFKHLDINGNKLPSFQAWLLVYAKGKPSPCYSTASPCESLKIAVEDGRGLSNDVWIKVGEPQTIRPEEVEVALHGSMCQGDFNKFRGGILGRSRKHYRQVPETAEHVCLTRRDALDLYHWRGCLVSSTGQDWMAC